MSGAGICMPTPTAIGALPFADKDEPVEQHGGSV